MVNPFLFSSAPFSPIFNYSKKTALFTLFLKFFKFYFVFMVDRSSQARLEAESAETSSRTTTTPDLSCIWGLRCSFHQCQILDAPSKNRDQNPHPHRDNVGFLPAESQWSSALLTLCKVFYILLGLL